MLDQFDEAQLAPESGFWVLGSGFMFFVSRLVPGDRVGNLEKKNCWLVPVLD